MQRVIDVIKQREEALSQIDSFPSSGKSVDELEQLLLSLRRLSIRTVELIVLWRDQFRYLSLVNNKVRIGRKKRAQKAIQTPYLRETEDRKYCENYLLKMKYDTKHFADNPMIKANFNVAPAGLSDPFLSQLSISGKVVAGGDIRQLKQQKNQQAKRVLAWGPDEIQKAKSCDEMLLFEKADSQCDKSWPLYAYCRPSDSNLEEFSQKVDQFIRESETNPAGIQPLNLANQASTSTPLISNHSRPPASSRR